MTDDSTPRHAGVNFPPPLIYLGGLLAGWLLNLWRLLPITPGPSVTRLAAAMVCIALWLVFMVAAFAVFRRARTSIIPNRPTAAIVSDGPYRITRNPMYVSMVAFYLGATLLINSWWPLVILPLVVIVIDRAVIAREERYLAAAFPVEYAEYAARVRRWL